MTNLNELFTAIRDRKDLLRSFLQKESLSENADVFLGILSTPSQKTRDFLLDSQLSEMLSLTPKALQSKIEEESDFEAARHLINAIQFLNATEIILDCVDGICMNGRTDNLSSVTLNVRRLYAQLWP
ncbi:MAG: hypothetical protein IIW99_08990 [Treponema sp.]|nr:hypothetical protein [Treponema sp.]